MTVLVLTMSISGFAQDPPPSVHLSGLISDYTPVTGVSGPWEMRGEWSLDLKAEIRPLTARLNRNGTSISKHAI